MMQKFATRVLLSASVTLGASATASADTILFSNLDANGTATGSSTIIGGPGAFGQVTVAADFTVTGDDYYLRTIEVVAAEFDTGSDTVVISLRADNSGEPGAILETLTFNGPLGDTNNPTTVLVTSVAQPLLTDGGRYWVAVTAGANERITWENTATGNDRDAHLDFDSDNTWEPTEFADPAFRVVGDIPEPGTVAVLSFLATPLLARRRR